MNASSMLKFFKKKCRNEFCLLVTLKEKLSKTTVLLLKTAFALWSRSSRLQKRKKKGCFGSCSKIYANLSMVVYESLTRKRILLTMWWRNTTFGAWGDCSVDRGSWRTTMRIRVQVPGMHIRIRAIQPCNSSTLGIGGVWRWTTHSGFLAVRLAPSWTREPVSWE